MTLERQALRVLLASFSGPTLPPEMGRLLGEGLGGVCLFGSNTVDGLEAVRHLTAAVHAAGPDALVAVDEEGGDVTRLHVRDGSPVLGAAALGFVGDLGATRSTGFAVGCELADVGVDLDLAPVADVNSCADNPVIGSRSFGADPAAVAAHVVAWLSGCQDAGVSACVKHFPGHGDTREDSHVALPVVDADLATLTARELVPFAAAVDAGVAAVMTSHIVVPALDPAGPATLSRPILSLLRDRLGFTGAIVTDALDMAGVSAGRGIPEAAVTSLIAGADLLCLGADHDADLVRAVRTAVVAAVREGRLAEQRLADAADRVGGVRRKAGADGAGHVDHAAAARASVALDGVLPHLAGATLVTVDTPATVAVGDVPWGLPADLVLDPGVPLTGRGPVVLQVRDAHRQEAVVKLLAEVEAAGRPAVVVEWGWPGPATTALPRIRVHGWSRPGAVAVSELLATAGWTP